MLMTSHSAVERGFNFTFDSVEDDGEGGGSLPGPWQLVVVDGLDIKLTECVYQRGPVTAVLDDIPHKVRGSGAVYLGVKIDLESGVATVEEGAAKGDVTDASIPADPQYLRKLLYALLVEDDSVHVVRDYRMMPEVVARV